MALFHSNAPRKSIHISPDRTKIRNLLKKASAGNVYAFTQATSSYFNLMSEYYYLLGFTDPRDRIFEIKTLISECWRFAQYTRRVSDFERLLQTQLAKRESDCVLDLPAPHESLGNLKHYHRFLLVARIFEDWSYRALHLAMRAKQKDISVGLMDLKCELTSFKPQMLKSHQQALLLRTSELLEAELAQKTARKLEQEIAREYHVLQFKADWLSYKCELVELRQKMRLDPSEMDQMKSELSESLKSEPTEHPKFHENVINQFSFSRLSGRSLKH